MQGTAHPPPRIGVIVAAHNAEHWIEATLQSVKQQTVDGWHCVVVDDGSSDATAEAVRRAVDGDARFRLVQQPNGGVAAARNTGLSLLPSVELLAFLDSDDLLLPRALDQLQDALDQRPDAVGAYGYAEYIDSDARPMRHGEHSTRQRSRRAVSGWRLRDVPEHADSTFEDLVVYSSIWPSAVALHRGEVVRRTGGFDAGLSRQEDWDLYLRMSRHGPFVVVPEQVAWYRRHTANLTSDHVTSCHLQAVVRRRSWLSSENGRQQRRAVARAWRYLEARDLALAVARAARGGSAPQRAQAVVAALTHGAALLRPGPPEPSLRRVRRTRAHEMPTPPHGSP